MLAGMAKAKGTRGQLAGDTVVRPPEENKALSDLGISKNQSSRWQKMAKMPQQPPTSENMSDIDFNGVTLGVTFKFIQEKLTVYM